MRTLALALLLGAACFAQRPGPQLTADLTRVSEHVHQIWGFPNIAFVTGSTGILVVDTGLGPANGKLVADAAQRIAPGRKLYLTTTHFHPEHAAGEPAFPPETVLIRPAAQQREMDQRNAAVLAQFKRNAEFAPWLEGVESLRPADITFEESLTLDLGGVQARLLWFGPGHTDGDELIFVEPDGVLISGDIVQNRTVPAVPAGGGSLANWLAMLDKIAALHPRIVLPTHARIGDGSLVAQQKAFMADIRARTLEWKRQGLAAAGASARIAEYFRAAYPEWAANPDWNNLAAINGLVQRIYAEDP
jgi:glyoxylase-like metal-dependent hydrolase (beta-lactamase superfamily II)